MDPTWERCINVLKSHRFAWKHSLFYVSRMDILTVWSALKLKCLMSKIEAIRSPSLFTFFFLFSSSQQIWSSPSILTSTEHFLSTYQVNVIRTQTAWRLIRGNGIHPTKLYPFWVGSVGRSCKNERKCRQKLHKTNALWHCPQI